MAARVILRWSELAVESECRTADRQPASGSAVRRPAGRFGWLADSEAARQQNARLIPPPQILQGVCRTNPAKMRRFLPSSGIFARAPALVPVIGEILFPADLSLLLLARCSRKQSFHLRGAPDDEPAVLHVPRGRLPDFHPRELRIVPLSSRGFQRRRFSSAMIHA